MSHARFPSELNVTHRVEDPRSGACEKKQLHAHASAKRYVSLLLALAMSLEILPAAAAPLRIPANAQQKKLLDLRHRGVKHNIAGWSDPPPLQWPSLPPSDQITDTVTTESSAPPGGPAPEPTLGGPPQTPQQSQQMSNSPSFRDKRDRLRAARARSTGQTTSGLSVPPLNQPRPYAGAPTPRPTPMPALSALPRKPGTAEPSPLIGQFGRSAKSVRAQQNRRSPMQPNSVVSTTNAPTTGITPFWDYDSRPVGGVGVYAVNVSTKNLVFASPDMVTPHRGVAFTLTRVYNSQSQHDTVGTDGSVASNYGNGMTNEFDARIANNDKNGLTVFDGTGARWDYLPNPDGNPCHLLPPPGQFATLTCDGSGVGYYWYLKSGVTLQFYAPFPLVHAGLSGRLHEIWGRNRNTWLRLDYFWTNADDSSASNLWYINVISDTTTVGNAFATLTFADFAGPSGTSFRLLSQLNLPDRITSVYYQYDTHACLTLVSRPENNSSGLPLKHNYAFIHPGHLMQWVNDPNWVGSNHYSGHYAWFAYSGSNVTGISETGWINPTVPAKTPGGADGGLIQPTSAPTGIVTYFNENYTYSAGNRLDGTTYSKTQFRDSDNHLREWDSYDATVPGLNQYLVFQEYDNTDITQLLTQRTWDTSDNLLETVDPRGTTDPQGHAVDFAYDTSGNLVAAAQPAVTTIQGTFRPTVLISYDPATNSPQAICDPVYTALLGKNWVNRPTQSLDSLCPKFGQAPGPQALWFTTDGPNGITGSTPNQPSYEPYGELAKVVSPTGGNTLTLAYSPAPSSDFGLPLSIAGTSFTQTADGSQISPLQQFIYDPSGNVACYSANSTFPGGAWWVMTYDSANRVTAAGDPDDTSITNGLCPAKAVQPAFASAPTNIATRYTYFPNGQVSTVQPASFAAGGQSMALQYDANGNGTSESHSYGCVVPRVGTPPPACAYYAYKFYDGADRLVEVALPGDNTNFDSFVVRYLYDLTQNSAPGVTLNYLGSAVATYYAHGNQFKTQKYTGGAASISQSSPPSWTWMDVDGQSFDGLNRPTGHLFFPPGSTGASSTQYSYDQSPYQGLLTQVVNGVGDTINLSTAAGNLKAYDARNLPKYVHFVPSGSSAQTPDLTYTRDANGRMASVATAEFGTESLAYDANGRVHTIQEPTGGSGIPLVPGSGTLTSAASYTLNYNPDDSLGSVDVDSSDLRNTGLRQLAYRSDGILRLEKAVIPPPNSTASFSTTRTAGGRIVSRSDPLNANAASLTYLPSGLVNSYTIPSGTYSALTYDLEGELVSYLANGPGVPSPVTVNYGYSNRGTLVGLGAGGNAVFPGLVDAGGAPLQPPLPYCYVDSHNFQRCGNYYSYFDGRSSAPLGAQWIPDGYAPPPTPAPRSINYDAAGRQVRKTFDVVDHVIVSGAQAYAWGPNGHPIFTAHAADGTVPRTIHWLGDRVLFSTMNNSTYEDLKLTSFANWTPGGVLQPVIVDRDLSGLAASSRTLNNGQDAWIVPSPYSACNDATHGTVLATPAPNTNVSPFNCNPSGSTPPPQYGGLFYEARSDGYWDGLSQINGARTYDSDVLAWSSMDAFGGVVGDPLSQLPYAYARNNPQGYSDASGLCPTNFWNHDGTLNSVWDIGPPCLPEIPIFLGGFGGPTYGGGGGGAGGGPPFSRHSCPSPPLGYGFVKCTINIGIYTQAIINTACGGTYFVSGITAGLPSVSFSLSRGNVFTGNMSPAGPSLFNGAMQGPSQGSSFGAGAGIEEWHSNDPPPFQAFATGIFTAQFGVSNTVGVFVGGKKC
jgi:YD repeat-containing protein